MGSKMIQFKKPGAKNSPTRITSARNADWKDFFYRRRIFIIGVVTGVTLQG
ncbi:hypothetical protein [Lacrimispora sp.]|uniref:hypothetical protein n=1 Tax=Lacrimispora sp. TaxID=2719234 RepID=UPI0028AD2678|nr:hypothetical protein [Lacrimispora sp.]